MPAEDALLSLFARSITDVSLRRTILVDNPARLYGFPMLPA
ncbi:hypothetical protein [Paraburkholderia unamae]|uniref:Uncharacterized protein n=1 Tax=Paraburkholderia unamae TaxID=219649 RepID=A0ACC6RMI8_9BURK